jgi:hypothetical protein
VCLVSERSGVGAMASLIKDRPDQNGSTGCDNRMFVEGVLRIVRKGSPWQRTSNPRRGVNLPPVTKAAQDTLGTGENVSVPTAAALGRSMPSPAPTATA